MSPVAPAHVKCGTGGPVGDSIDGNGLAVLERGECLRLLAGERVGRVGVSMGALPAILPVNYALLDEDVVFVTGPGSKLSAAADGNVVTFEVDRYDPVYHSGWSVMVTGRSEVLSSPADLAAAGRLPLEPWAHVPLREFVRVRSEYVSGRCLRPNLPVVFGGSRPRPI